jgi:AcrR family transcriptional regulator
VINSRSAAKPIEGDLRGRVLHAAVELLNQDGLAALSVREVARRAGVSHQAPYHHFASREDILAAIAQQGFEMLERGIAEARSQARDARDAFERAGRAYVEFALRHPAHFRLMFRPELVDVQRHPEAMSCGARAFAHVPALVRELVTQGLPAEPSEQAVVTMAWATVHGLACLLLDGPLGHVTPLYVQDPKRGVSDVVRAVGELIARASSTHGKARKTGSKR